MNVKSTKPYLIRSIYDWCIDSDFTPFVSIKAYPELNMPKDYVKNGEIVFNIGAKAVQDLIINNDFISFKARFNGVERKLDIPMIAVKGIFAKEVNQGIAFSPDKEKNHQDMMLSGTEEIEQKSDSSVCQPKKTNRPNLRIVK